MLVTIALAAFGQEAAPAEKSEKKIQLSEAPAKVQTAFKSSEYKDATVSEIVAVTDAGATTYKIIVGEGDERKELVYDAEGNAATKKEE